MKEAIPGTFLPASADALARIHTAEAMGVIVEAMRGEIPGIKPDQRLKAAQTILERGHGKAVQAVIQVPARARIAAQLASLSDEALLEIAQRGSGGRKEGPQGTGSGDGSIQEGEYTENNASASGNALVPTARSKWHKDSVDAEIEDEDDPCS
jgi:hypothetical protein